MEKDTILEAMNEQAKHINKDTWLCIVEDFQTALTGNICQPSALWVHAKPTDNLNFAKGLPHVAIFPKSKESATLWKQTGIGKVLSVVSNPTDLIPP